VTSARWTLRGFAVDERLSVAVAGGAHPPAGGVVPAAFCDPDFDVPNPGFSRKERKLLAERDRRLSRAQKRSRRSGKARRRRARAISDAGWGHWLAVLAWHAKKAGRDIVVYDPRHTTQTCSACGTKAKPRLGLADRTFACHACSLVLDRDRNAAYNLDPGRAGPGVGVDGAKPWISAENQAA